MSRIEPHRMTWPELVSGYQRTISDLNQVRDQRGVLDRENNPERDPQWRLLYERQIDLENDLDALTTEVLVRVADSRFSWIRSDTAVSA